MATSSIVSHDIRSPLALQFQLVELLEEDRDSFDTYHREIIEKLADQTRNTLRMTNNLLEWFRSQREDMVLRPQLLELSEVVEDCCHLLHITSEIKQITVNNNIASGTQVYADREAIGLIILNLLSNAIKLTGTSGSVDVDALLSGDMVIVSVRDNGVGMEAVAIEIEKRYIGELFEGKNYDWANTEKERLTMLFVSFVKRIASWLLARKRFSEAVQMAKKILSRNEFDEESNLLMLNIFAMMGDRQSLNNYYESYTQLLLIELSMQPSNKIQQLIQRFK